MKKAPATNKGKAEPAGRLNLKDMNHSEKATDDDTNLRSDYLFARRLSQGMLLKCNKKQQDLAGN
ncbi:Uncharacterised protein [Ewingella americana]|uniref:Uncharacterized protein n=1 Tax=Ewingella americana TaxID=41202 RepID=A0A377NF97_9GAMM|nr:Uncharacterised protein [Ewingella americana]